MRIPIWLRSTAVEEHRPTVRPPLTVDGLGITRSQSLARLREAIERRTMEGEAAAQTFPSDGAGSTDLTV